MTLKGLREMKLQTDKQTNKWHDKVLNWQTYSPVLHPEARGLLWRCWYSPLSCHLWRDWTPGGYTNNGYFLRKLRGNVMFLQGINVTHVNQSSSCDPFNTTAICSCCCFLPPPSLAIVVSQASSFYDLHRSLQSDLEAICLIYLAAAHSRRPAVAKPQARRHKNI